MAPRTLLDKIWDAHVVERFDDGTCVLYIDRHLLDEVHSPQAFEGLRAAGRRCAARTRPSPSPTTTCRPSDRRGGIGERPRASGRDAGGQRRGVRRALHPVLDVRQGIVHVIGPELGFSLPGQTIVSGDSHASTNGALGALAFGIGASEVEHVLATQTLLQKKPAT